MEIIIGKTAGFCFGVKNAVDNTIKEINKEEKTYCLGELVHNKQVTEELISKGVTFIEKIEDADNKCIIRAHGVPQEIYEKAKKLNIELIDLTCPKVIHIHNLAMKYNNEGYFIFLIGKKTHPEIIGTISFCGKNCSVIENIDEVEEAVNKYKKCNLRKAVVIVQTTFSTEEFNKISQKIQREIKNIEIRNTICSSTKQRQEETINISKNVDCMIVIGGKHSSNSNELYEIAKNNCQHTFFVETKEELDMEKIKKFKKVGIMAGASTSEKSIQEIVDIIKKTC